MDGRPLSTIITGGTHRRAVVVTFVRLLQQIVAPCTIDQNGSTRAKLVDTLPLHFFDGRRLLRSLDSL